MSLAFNKFNSFVADIGDGVFDLGLPDTLDVALFQAGTTPTASDSRYNASAGFQLNSSGATEVANGNGYTAGGQSLSSVTYTQTSGLATLACSSSLITWTASVSGFSFRYIVLYDASAGVATARPLIGWWDRGATLTLTAGQTYSVSFPSGVFTLQ